MRVGPKQGPGVEGTKRGMKPDGGEGRAVPRSWDGTHLKGKHQRWDRQQDAEAEGGYGETKVILCWGRQGEQHDWPRREQWLMGLLH